MSFDGLAQVLGIFQGTREESTFWVTYAANASPLVIDSCPSCSWEVCLKVNSGHLDLVLPKSLHSQGADDKTSNNTDCWAKPITSLSPSEEDVRQQSDFTSLLSRTRTPWGLVLVCRPLSPCYLLLCCSKHALRSVPTSFSVCKLQNTFLDFMGCGYQEA